ncbi:hypothetical protein L1987_11468 [Smallanthus sonchifolius]|uniref:Uncharacterized protein n=1 Tax=Smallanthus sonchifolius TaxID=185202 RepID=A0ACB9JBE8_9ASTR|nr:hypothetical protein L1987_11468 [Smallanthus sonchifolius]
MHWVERIQEWIVYGAFKVDICDRFAFCGPYGSCSIEKHPSCTCMPGFEPRNPEEWDASDWSSGCTRKTPLNCGNLNGDGFRRTTGHKAPDTRRSWFNVSMTLGECEMACRRNCSCTAYANLDIRNGGSGCLLWFDELIDIRDYDEDHDIYIRMAASELADHQTDSNRRKRLFTRVLSISSAALLLCAIAYACKKRIKRLRMKGQGDMEYALDKKNTSVQTQLLGDIPFISLYKLAKATNNFCESNKIGEGDFGPVYKGVLEDGQEVAMKRLSDTSQQGIDEFKNEVISISKLQHRNLVKLLGYCVLGNEMILIYELTQQKHTKTNISNCTDETRRLTLDWPQLVTFSPEYAVHGRFSIKSDVFSFGVLVLEMVSGKKNREFSHEDHSDNLLGHAWRLYKQGSDGALPTPKQPAFFSEDESTCKLDFASSLDEYTITELYPR